MSLIPLEPEETSASSQADKATVPDGRQEVTLNEDRRQMIGVRLGKVERIQVTRTIRAAGRIEASEHGLSAVSLKYGGWVEQLHVKAVGDRVRKGDPLFDIYSPELMEAQSNYLLALETHHAGESNERNLQAARDRLLLWDVTPEQIDQLEQARKPLLQMSVLAEADGVVMERNIVQGSFAAPGIELYRLADLSRVWVRAEVYEYESSGLQAGSEAQVRLSDGTAFSAKIGYLYPTIDAMTRTIGVRLEAPNPDGRLKPGMFGEVEVLVDLGERLVVDDEAILDSGTRAVVFVSTKPGHYAPREVKLGERVNGRTIVLEGLHEGETVAISGNFLLDAESKLKAALRQASGGQAGGDPTSLKEHQH
jgi:Cu(I)/Ag(I) efflux system membrane fusion protein